ncbi:PrsW family intramembrane metalloprotease [Streptomyces broussonetiae]|uniref:PrsW family intramembrane metalloprotease n=1 Tax=Streptomyces broussonetiae TaxID=2686304 RepID=A0A6I6MVQ7_9ACTN|nr:PrsW family glutamic-type intramembrane protease [Streptomyces broussonetiae]QHA04818.1 PrsW family intramembrane metalloprotease [Streptomyces broussonetiae]
MSHSPPPGTPKARIPGPQQPPPPYPRIRAGLWRHCLGGGLALWALTAWVTYETQNSALLPTLVLLGSFLVPVVFVLWAYERHGRDLGVSAVLGCFLTGGALGVLGASLTASYPLRPALEVFTGAGPIEEAAKLAALVFVLRGRPGIRGTRAGLVLGAAVGFGFAALESAGYAFATAATTAGVGLRTLLETEILRGVLAPLGHGLWTAIAGGVLLSRRRPTGHFRITAPIAGTCLGVCLLHALWDATHGLALWGTARLTGADLDRPLFTQALPTRPSAVQEHLFTLFSVGGLALVALGGIGWIRSLARRDPSWRNTP